MWETEREGVQGVTEYFISQLLRWLIEYTHLLKLIQLHILNGCGFYVNYSLMNLFKTKKIMLLYIQVCSGQSQRNY